MQFPQLSRLGQDHRRQMPRHGVGSSSMVERLEQRTLLSVFYVSTSGNNGNNGLSPGSAWATPQYAADQVAAGDTVHVAAGTYGGFDFRTSGTASQRITFSGDPGATINTRNRSTPDGINLEGASYVTIEGFTMTGNGMPTTNPNGTTNSNGTRAGIRAVLTWYVIIRNNTCDNWGVWGSLVAQSNYPTVENNTFSRSVKEHGLYVSDSTNYATVRGNTIWGNTGNGIHCNPDINLFNGFNDYELIEKNTIYGNGNNRTYTAQNGTQYTWNGGGAGINMSGVRYSTIQDNLLYDNSASGMTLYFGEGAGGSSYNTIVNNTVVMKPGSGRNVILIGGNSHDNTIFNNILYTDVTIKSAIDINNSDGSLTGFRSDYNVVCNRFGYNDNITIVSLAQWQATTGQDTHSIISTPAALFADYAGRNFNLSPASVALNAGVASFNGKNAPAYDYTGAPRPVGLAYDIGALELDRAPTDITLSPNSIAENQPSGTAVGTLGTSDPDAGDSFTYSLVSGAGSADNASFTISGGTLQSAAIFNFEAKNSYSIRVRTTDQGGLWYEKSFTIRVTDVDEIAPTVTAVYVKGSAWNTNFLSFLAANVGGSSSTYGFAIPVGAGSTQLQTLPWRNLNQISVAFSEDVSVAQAQFAIVGSVGSYNISGFSYSSSDHVATWSLSAAIGADKLYIALPGSGATPVTDVAGNVLDGEWTNPTSYSQVGVTSTFPSGNGVAGGDFAFRFDVLPGDSTGGSLGKVNVADINQTKSRSSLPETASSYRSDFDGNGLVNVADINYVKSRSSISSLPVNPPVLPMFSTVSISESLLTRRRYSLY